MNTVVLLGFVAKPYGGCDGQAKHTFETTESNPQQGKMSLG